jgi:hypothetical protein
MRATHLSAETFAADEWVATGAAQRKHKPPGNWFRILNLY